MLNLKVGVKENIKHKHDWIMETTACFRNSSRNHRLWTQFTEPSTAVSFREDRPYFSNNTKPHTALQQRGTVVEAENIWHVIKTENRTIEQLSYIWQEWDNICLPKVQQLVTSVPRWL